ncbi:hypothetical protein [Mesorhizobium sp. P16.1]|uniref:hypothetical protein n=1 Tax=Mesorhizobium sp. P16.1 TaxID=3033796 RepID=UPI0031F8F99C
MLHALIAAFLVYTLPKPAQQPDEEQPVNVALVPPPEQPKPKPPPAPQPNELKAEKPPEPKAEKPPEQKVEKPPVPEKQPPKPPPIAVLKPVFQYGNKDTGPRKSLDGPATGTTRRRRPRTTIRSRLPWRSLHRSNPPRRPMPISRQITARLTRSR